MEVILGTFILGICYHGIICQENEQTETEDPIRALGLAIPGVAGEDYPIYSQPPDTFFSCDGQVNGGYYADPEAQCQSFHICAGVSSDRLNKFSFLCPNGTLFQQQYFVCDWWFNVDCSKTEKFYALNSELEDAREAGTLSSSERRSNSVESENKQRIKETKEITERKFPEKINIGSSTSNKFVKKPKQSGKNLNGRKGNRRKGSGLRRGDSSSSPEIGEHFSDLKSGSNRRDFQFPLEDLPSLDSPSHNTPESDNPGKNTPSAETPSSLPRPIETLYGAPLESFVPIEEQIFSFEAEIPPENSRRARALEKDYRDYPEDSKSSLPSQAFIQQLVGMVNASADL